MIVGSAASKLTSHFSHERVESGNEESAPSQESSMNRLQYVDIKLDNIIHNLVPPSFQI